ncbi:MAG: hypothetical protein HRT44_03550 [Bdellovibrionales bacterium]|nr:hypothetical protein [Bdellovibrionales bacterium]
MTGEPPTFDHTDLKKIKSIEDAKKACVSLLDSVSHIKTKNEESKKVLNRFHELHQEWFLVKERINVSHSLSHSFMLDTYDGTEPALYFTKTLFDNSSPFHSVVTSNEYYKARRSQGPAYHQSTKRVP